ncbi:MAG TPA: hypothetical protein ENJ95_15955 [Bacteroidetes bacterium]|nr:hypothetical protein [Bacteroidota bacterium]
MKYNFDWKRYASSIRQTFLNALLSYISSATGFTKKEFQLLAKPLPKPINNFIMVTMESILEEGIEIGIKKGEVLGIKKGEVIGIKKGEVLGMEKGMMKKAKEFAIKLIQNFPKLSDKKIAEMTGLPKADVSKLRKELKKKPNGLNGNGKKSEIT